MIPIVAMKDGWMVGLTESCEGPDEAKEMGQEGGKEEAYHVAEYYICTKINAKVSEVTCGELK